jgi:hypothetical protein
MLLTILHQAALPFARRAGAFALDDILRWLRRRGFLQLLDEARVRTRPVLSLGVLRLRVSTLSHVHRSSRLCDQMWTTASTSGPWTAGTGE